jgi:hypothetical protein
MWLPAWYATTYAVGRGSFESRGGEGVFLSVEDVCCRCSFVHMTVFHTHTLQRHLDLTTSRSKLRAHMYGTPAIADIDRDGRTEIVVGTSLGNVYVLNYRGEPKPGFPVQMAEIQGSVALGDVLGDAKLEIIVADRNGNVVVFDHQGNEVGLSSRWFSLTRPHLCDVCIQMWDRHISGFSPNGRVLGDGTSKQ